jgi:hypothetical protein
MERESGRNKGKYPRTRQLLPIWILIKKGFFPSGGSKKKGARSLLHLVQNISGLTIQVMVTNRNQTLTSGTAWLDGTRDLGMIFVHDRKERDFGRNTWRWRRESGSSRAGPGWGGSSRTEWGPERGAACQDVAAAAAAAAGGGSLRGFMAAPP